MKSAIDYASPQTPKVTGQSPRRSRIAKTVWFMLALLVAFIATGIYIPPHVHLSVARLLAIWLGDALLGYVGVQLGDAVRRIARPDIIVATGGVSNALWARICQCIGPRIVSLYLGAVAGTSILAGGIA
jgi:hypothetical protein